MAPVFDQVRRSWHFRPSRPTIPVEHSGPRLPRRLASFQSVDLLVPLTELGSGRLRIEAWTVRSLIELNDGPGSLWLASPAVSAPPSAGPYSQTSGSGSPIRSLRPSDPSLGTWLFWPGDRPPSFDRGRLQDRRSFFALMLSYIIPLPSPTAY
jgi:hypothetical protein